MTLSNRVRCFVEMAIMMLAVAAPSFAQISAHGYISDCDQTKAPPYYAKVWSLIQIGKVFDITSQRERAVAQYQLAIQTGDNTGGAIIQARELLEHPFEWPANQ
jgi:hypothetical protein